MYGLDTERFAVPRTTCVRCEFIAPHEVIGGILTDNQIEAHNHVDLIRNLFAVICASKYPLVYRDFLFFRQAATGTNIKHFPVMVGLGKSRELLAVEFNQISLLLAIGDVVNGVESSRIPYSGMLFDGNVEHDRHEAMADMVTEMDLTRILSVQR